MKLLFFKFRTGNALLSRKGYYTFSIVAWFYTIVWLACLFLVWYYLETALWVKIGLNFVLVILTPALSDLTKAYGKYKAEWEQEHGRRTG